MKSIEIGGVSRIKIIRCLVILTVLFFGAQQIVMAERIPTTTEEHNWQQSSVHYDTILVGEHEYTYWKNFMKRKRTCTISHRIKTVVYYCDIHNHTKVETFLDEVIHSEKHRDGH
ncbi:hypothetical protein H8S33_13055 [Ornithinibacillus sp. BX22]|uniref:Uncharacterized protein n=2 Tax=Ornithinibacillus TaxID=484508 RepID=A0A923L773_9BACI|nr:MULTISPECIES: hypothetical protein [Ornithinibacillus]MBC5637738.1 hypothetical protein [Ornithinibacillus hominis]MBS3681588.1 hypothetical protein [Ornithinibacillus massiliensis]